MGDGSNQHLFLRALLQIGDLDIRRISRDYLSLKMGEYFKTVEKFVNRVPMAMESLTKIASLTAADYDFRTLKDIKQFLDDIGYEKSSNLEEIVKAGKRGHSKFASDCVKEMLDDFSVFCTRISAVYKTSGAEVGKGDPDKSDSAPEKYNEQMLKDILQQVDGEEFYRRAKILAVDDSPVALKNITTALSNDYDVFTIANPIKVEDFLMRTTPDLFLLDYKMPELNGFELVPIIRSFPEHKYTPVIFLTAMGTPDYVSTALALGACDYIVKPFQADNLLAKVTKHLSRKKSS